MGPHKCLWCERPVSAFLFCSRDCTERGVKAYCEAYGEEIGLNTCKELLQIRQVRLYPYADYDYVDGPPLSEPEYLPNEPVTFQRPMSVVPDRKYAKPSSSLFYGGKDDHEVIEHLLATV